MKGVDSWHYAQLWCTISRIWSSALAGVDSTDTPVT